MSELETRLGARINELGGGMISIIVGVSGNGLGVRSVVYRNVVKNDVIVQLGAEEQVAWLKLLI